MRVCVFSQVVFVRTEKEAVLYTFWVRLFTEIASEMRLFISLYFNECIQARARARRRQRASKNKRV